MKTVKVKFQVMADAFKKELNGIKRFTSDVSGWTKLKAAANKYGKSVAALGTVFRGLKKTGSVALKGLGMAWKGLGSVMRGVRNIVLIGVGAVTGIGAASLKSAADIETLKLRLEGVTGSADKANDIFKEVYKFFIKSPFELEPLIEARILLEGLGITGQKSLESVANAAAIMDRSIVDMAAVMGGMEAEPLRRLGINLKRDGDAFIFEYLDKMGEVHEITADGRRDAQKELLKIFDIKFGGSLDRLSRTWHGMISTLKGSMKGAFADFGEGLLPAFNPILKQINDGIQELGENGTLEKAGKKFGALISDAMASLMAGVQVALDAVSQASLGGVLSAVVGALVDLAITLLAAGLMSLKSVFVALAKIMSAALAADFMKMDIWGRNEEKNARKSAKKQLSKMTDKQRSELGVPEIREAYPGEPRNVSMGRQMAETDEWLKRKSLDDLVEIATTSRDTDIGTALEKSKSDFAAIKKGMGNNLDNLVENAGKRIGFDFKGAYQAKLPEVRDQMGLPSNDANYELKKRAAARAQSGNGIASDSGPSTPDELIGGYISSFKAGSSAENEQIAKIEAAAARRDKIDSKVLGSVAASMDQSAEVMESFMARMEKHAKRIQDMDVRNKQF